MPQTKRRGFLRECSRSLLAVFVVIVNVISVGTTGRRLHHDSTCTEHSMPVDNISVCTDIGIGTDATDNTTGCRYGST